MLTAATAPRGAPISPADAAVGPVFIDVQADGAALANTAQVTRIEIESMASGATAHVEALESDASPGAFGGRAYEPGRQIEISAGYGGEAAAPLFSGRIERSVLELSPDAAAIVILEAAGTAGGAASQGIGPALVVTFSEDLIFGRFETGAGENGHDGARGEVTFQGSALARPGALIRLKEIGPRFSGDYRIRAVVHEFEAGEWLTTVRFGPATPAQ